MSGTRPALLIQRRNRYVYACLIVGVVGVGLASRKFPSLFSLSLGKYPGDGLWALMVFLLWGWLKPASSTAMVAVLALATSFVIEFSQLYHEPWIDALRGTQLGHFVLGSVFNWADLLAYFVGVLVGAAGEWMIRIYRARPGNSV